MGHGSLSVKKKDEKDRHKKQNTRVTFRHLAVVFPLQYLGQCNVMGLSFILGHRAPQLSLSPSLSPSLLQQHFFPRFLLSRSRWELMLTVSFSRSLSRSARLWLCFLAPRTMLVKAMNICKGIEPRDHITHRGR